MGNAPLEKIRTGPEAYTLVFFCPIKGRGTDNTISGTTKTLGGRPVNRIEDIKCRYGIADPPHKDKAAIVAIPLSTITDGTARTAALRKAEELFPDIPSSPTTIT